MQASRRATELPEGQLVIDRTGDDGVIVYSLTAHALVAMERFDRFLADRAFIAGEAYSVADITGLVAIDMTRLARIAVPEELGNLRRWREAVSARPSAKA